MKKLSFTALCCAVLLSGSAPMLQAADNAHTHSDNNGTVLLPVQSGESRTSFITPDQAANANGWNTFMQQYGEWTVLLDKTTGTPHQAFGKPIRIQGYETITADNIEAAASAFLREHASVLRVDPSHLKLVRTTLVNNRWYVSYVQVENGVEVLLSGVELRIFANGNVMAFGVDYYPELSLNLKPSISYSSAITRSTTGMENATAVVPAGEAAAPGTVYVLPVKGNDEVSYKLVYKIPIHTATGRYLSFVDAHSGSVLWRYNRSHGVSTDVTISGGVKMNTPLDEEEVRYFPYQTVTIGGQEYTTDENGALNVDVQSGSSVSATFDGPYAVVRPTGKTAGKYTGTVQPGTPLNIVWDDNNSLRYERILFYHVNRVRELWKEVDPSLTVMDRPMYLTLDYSPSQANAFSNDDSITFLALSDNATLMADGPSVLYHEYGHSLNNLLYQSLGRPDGMINPACHEGTADVASCLLLDESRVGVGVFADNSERYIRNIQNDMVWPDSAMGESHNDGQILAAAFWDLRNSLSREESLKLAHFAKYGLPDDPEDGIAFNEWFIETLIADDDDGDLTNGTPHAVEIITAFNRHHIGTDLLLRRTFAHNALPDTKETAAPYGVDFSLGGLTVMGGKADSVAVVYSLNGSSEWSVVPATEMSNSQYMAAIPAQPRGTYVQYYIRAWDPYGKSSIQFSSDASMLRPYKFLVGYTLSSTDKFTQDLGWIVGGSGDNATTGVWERAEPEEIDFRSWGSVYVQPGTDYSDQGTLCFVTGNRGGFNFQEEMLRGVSTLTSPEYDLSTLEKPVVRLQRWFTTVSLDGVPPVESTLRAEYSADGGNQWSTIETITMSGPNWQKVLYPVPTDAQNSTRFRMRFVATNIQSPQAFLPPVMKVLIDDFDILTANEVVTGVNDAVELPGRVVSYPNPFSSETTIGYDAPAGNATVKVYTVLGEEVVSLASGYSESGRHEVRWNGRDAQGRTVAPGMYIVQVQAGDLVQKQIVVRY